MSEAIKTQVGGRHYVSLPIQPIDYIMANGIPFAEANIIKYATRWRDKGGVEDLQKIKHYVDLLIERDRKAEGGRTQEWVDEQYERNR